MYAYTCVYIFFYCISACITCYNLMVIYVYAYRFIKKCRSQIMTQSTFRDVTEFFAVSSNL